MIYLLFNYLATDNLEWAIMRLNITLHPNDKYQKVCKYLQAILEYQETKSYDNYDIRAILSMNSIPVQVCQGML